MPRRVLIMGAAGRDFHNFNVACRGDRQVKVVAFTATQIPFIQDRTYPNPREVADFIAFLLSARAAGITGSDHLVDGGAIRTA